MSDNGSVNGALCRHGNPAGSSCAGCLVERAGDYAEQIGLAVGSSVTRLPVAHRQKPHCVACGRDLPNFDSADLFTTVLTDVELLGVTFHIRCRCGKAWDLRKSTKGGGGNTHPG